jgi:monoamine oxidase
VYGKGQWFSIRPILAAKFVNIHFAGEHIADWQGFMEGAVATGAEAAEAALS